MNITVIGCGRWGTFLAWYLCDLGHRVTLYGRESSPHMLTLRQTRQNDLLRLPDALELTTALAKRPELYVISIGSQGLRSLLRTQKDALAGIPLVLCMKGLEVETGQRLTEIVREELGENQPVAVWLGPGHVQEFLKRVPNCMVIDSADNALKEQLVDAFSSELIRFYYGRDLIGNEIGAASKNVIGIAAGMLDGLGLGTLKGALMSRGTREIARLIAALGGSELSAYGLCHLGDYEATVFSPHSHNRAFGECFVRNQPYTQLAEGCSTVQALMALQRRTGVELPICDTVNAILHEGQEPKACLGRLFSRSLKSEF